LTLEEILQYPEDQENLELKRKIDSITQYCSKPYFKEALKKLAIANSESANIICEYIIAEQNEMNIKESTKEGKIKILIWLSNYINKPFGKMTKEDILNYLNYLRRPLSEDPTHKWVGSYNARQMILNKFFRWLYNPDEPDPRKRISPPCMKGVKKLPRQEKSPYKPSNLWDAREHAIFLKYCPSKRDRCYHAIANDMSARPHEILNLKIKDIVFKITEDGIQYAEVLITGGKTPPRTIPLIDSMPYVKDWIHDHPTGTNPESWLFVSRGNNAFGSKLTYDGLFGQYKYYYKARYFPKLLEKDETIPEADKAFIKNMLTKPWNLYIFRHSALTEKSQILKESVLRDHAGWTMTSKMPQVYIHYFGNESSKSLLEARGVMKEKDSRIVALKSKQCPSCNEPNKSDSKFCAKCRMVLTYDAYNETLDKQQQKDNEIRTIKEQFISMQSQMQALITTLGNMDDTSKNDIPFILATFV
jgi:integrase